MKYTVYYESKPGMWELYSGTKTVEADNEEDAIEKAYRLIRKTFFDRSRSGWIFSIQSCGTSDA